MSNGNVFVVKAIKAIKEIDPGYWESTLKQRLPGGAGSYYPQYSTPEEMEIALLVADWYAVLHPALAEDTVAFITKDLGAGVMNVVKLSHLPEEQTVVLDDRKNTGFVSAVVYGADGDTSGETYIIIGKEKGVDVAFTFHPGPPVEKSDVPTGDLHGKEITVKEAMDLGLRTAKIAGPKS